MRAGRLLEDQIVKTVKIYVCEVLQCPMCILTIALAGLLVLLLNII